MYSVWLKSRFILTGLLLFYTVLAAQGQFHYFNVLQFPGNNNASVLENDTGYVLLQQGNPQVKDLYFHHYDKNGSYLQSDSTAIGAFYEDSKQGLIAYKNGYLKLGTLFYGTDSGEVHLVHLSPQLDTLKTFKYSYAQDVGTEGLSVSFFNANQIVICGLRFYRSSGQRAGLALVLDTNFSVVWDSIYPAVNQNEPGGYAFFDAVQMGDGGYLFSGLKGFFFSNSNSKPKGLLLKTDSLGREEWRQELTGPEGNNEVLLQKLTDSTVAFVTARIDSPDTQPFTRLRTGIVNSKGVILNDTTFGPLTRNMQTQFFKTTRDGNLIVGGYAQGLGFKSYAIKFKSNGEIIWFREYFNGNEIGFDKGELASLIFTQDGGLLFAGSFFDRDGLGTHQWLVKTDSFGCAVPGCQNIGLREASADKPSYFTLYPNPAQDQATLSWQIPPSSSTRNLSIKIVNLQGQTLQSIKEIEAKSQAHVLDLSHYPAGIYFLWLYSPLAPPQVLSLQVK